MITILKLQEEVTYDIETTDKIIIKDGDTITIDVPERDMLITSDENDVIIYFDSYDKEIVFENLNFLMGEETILLIIDGNYYVDEIPTIETAAGGPGEGSLQGRVGNNGDINPLDLNVPHIRAVGIEGVMPAVAFADETFVVPGLVEEDYVDIFLSEIAPGDNTLPGSPPSDGPPSNDEPPVVTPPTNEEPPVNNPPSDNPPSDEEPPVEPPSDVPINICTVTDDHYVVIGTESDDVNLNGRSHGQVYIEGLGGDDKINGNNESDILKGGVGNDTIHGNLGDDCIRGGEGDDILFGNNGNDMLIGGLGNDILRGGNGDDSFMLTIDDTIVDFGQGNDKDVLDLRKLFDLDQVDDIDNYLRFDEDGKDTKVMVDVTGTGTSFGQVALLEKVTGLGVDEMVTNGEII
tara:strand:+ start:2826 stop:4040 length:1215 start_codon:yes stop_codon:yes gene_type:complete